METGTLLKRGFEIALAVALIASGVVSFAALNRDYPNADLLVSSEWLRARLSDPNVRIVDARGPLKYRAGHIPGAVNISDRDVHTWTRGVARLVAPEEQIEAVFGRVGIDRDTTVVVYSDPDNLWAARLFWILELYGHPTVKILNGGIGAWQQAGGELTETVSEVSERTFDAKPVSDRIITAAWLTDHLEDPGLRIVDARPMAEYLGQSSRARRDGRIPNAASRPWSEVLDRDGHLARSLDLQIRFEDADVDRNHTVVIYSQTGVEAAVDYLALRLLGYPDVRLYDGSWAEWGNDTQLPIAVAVSGSGGQPGGARSTCW
ncbi:MAG: sulfurtransferase [Candidatus Bipolaricaulia bacterium]